MNQTSLRISRHPPKGDRHLFRLQGSWTRSFFAIAAVCLLGLGLDFLHASELRQAIREGDLEEVKEQIEADVNLVNEPFPRTGATPLILAANAGNAEIVKYLLSKGADINGKSRDNAWTVLHWALGGTGGDKASRKATASVIIAGKPRLDARDENGRTPLHHAVEKDFSVAVSALIKLGADANARDEFGRTPLHEAGRKNRSEIVAILAAGGANANATDKKGHTPLTIAVRSGSLAAAAALLKHGAKVDKPTEKGLTPLHDAARGGTVRGGSEATDVRSKLLNLLITNKADVNAATEDNRTPLHFAAEAGRVETVEFLLKSGAAVNPQDDYGRTPLFMAESARHEPIIRILAEKDGRNLLRYRARLLNKFWDAIKRGDTDFVEGRLTDYPGLANDRSRGASPLHIALDKGHKDLFMALLPTLKEINEAALYPEGTPLHIACAGKLGTDPADLILARNPDVNAISPISGDTPLHIAARHGRQKIVAALLEREAKVNIQNARGLTPVFDAMKHGPIFDTLVEKGASLKHVTKDGTTLLHKACERADLDLMEELLEEGLDPAAKTKQGLTPLLALVTYGSRQAMSQQDVIDMAKALLKHAQDVDAVDERRGCTSLHMAALFGSEPLCAVLIDHKADISRGDRLGRTPLHIAVQRRNTDLAELLIEKKANVNARDAQGRTPLHDAVISGQEEFVRLLLKAGADSKLKDNYARTAAFLARRFEREEILTLLGK